MKKVVSFSGGESSGLALIETLKEHPDAIVVFMNTSKEREETLEFINKVSIHFNINVRTKNQFQFAPVIKCVSTQKIEIILIIDILQM